MALDIETHTIEFSTRGNTHILDITDKVNGIIASTGFEEAQATIFGIGSTTGIGTVEYEPGLVGTDLAGMFHKIAPYGVAYEHNKTWGDDNGAAHLRSTLQGTSLVVPVKDARLMLGTWQQIIFIDFDTRPRSRKVVVQLIGRKR
jgi:secondary thiamine-phosphate synthase enzyme